MMRGGVTTYASTRAPPLQVPMLLGTRESPEESSTDAERSNARL